MRTTVSRPLASESPGQATFPLRSKDRRISPDLQVEWKTNGDGMDASWRRRPSYRTREHALLRCATSTTSRSFAFTNRWDDTSNGASGSDKIYVVQTNTKVIERCMLMCTDPGDLVLDPTCGSGTTAFVAEQWGRRWITVDTSRVALALARQRLMGASTRGTCSPTPRRASARSSR